MQRFRPCLAMGVLGLVTWAAAPASSKMVLAQPSGVEAVLAGSDLASTLGASLAGTWVIPTGKETVIRRSLEPAGARGWLLLQEATVDRDHILVRYGKTRDGEPRLAVTLRHPSAAVEGDVVLGHMAIRSTPGPAAAKDLAILAARLKAAGDALAVWQHIEPEPAEQEQAPKVEPPAPQVAAEAAALQATMQTLRVAFSRGNDGEVRTLLDSLDPTTIKEGGVRMEMALSYARMGVEEKVHLISRTFPEDPARGEESLFGPALRAELPAPAVLFEGRSDHEICELYRIGDILAQAGRTGPAETLLSAIVARVPTCARAGESWGLMLLNQRRGDPAIEALRPHQQRDPSDIRLTLALSHAYRMTGELAEAIRLFHTTAETIAYDEHNQYLGQLLALYLTSSTVDDWVEHWRDVLEWNPDHVTGRFLLGACLHYLDAFEESNVHLEKLIGVIDHEPRLYVYQAMNHFNLGDTAKARELLEEGTRLAKVDPDVFYCRAEITRDTERDLAISDLERYLTLTARSQYENPNKRARVVAMRDALVACKADGTPVCDGPWEHPRSLVLGFIKRNESLVFFSGGLALFVLALWVRRRRRGRATS